MLHYGLIGNPVAHSRSPQLFADYCDRRGIAGADYSLFSLNEEVLQPDSFRQWLHRQGLSGFNVTVPYKRRVIPLLDALSPEAETIGAVNCVAVEREDNSLNLIGHNTDAPAFRQTLVPLLRPHHTEALILGTGGAAQAVAYVLRQLDIDYLFVSRTPAHAARPSQTIGYSQALEQADRRTLIVNATPVGMSTGEAATDGSSTPKSVSGNTISHGLRESATPVSVNTIPHAPYESATPWPDSDLLTPRHLVYDLIYNPRPTRLLQEAARHGATVQDGLPMLQLQALLSYKIWQLDRKTLRF